MIKTILHSILIFSCVLTLAQSEYIQIDSVLSELTTNDEFNGIVLIGNSDSIQFSKSYGFASMENKSVLDLNTQFYIASISKQFTATSILLLQEKGSLELNQLVQDILPLFPYKEVTLHHLLSNSSGISDYIDFFAENWNTRKQANTDNVLDYLYEYSPKRDFNSGSKFEYSNTNYVILAKVIEKLSGLSYPSFLEKNIFVPCGLINTYATYKPYFTNQDINVAYGYVLQEGVPIRNDLSASKYIDRVNYLSGIQGDGSVVTTIADLYLWHKALLTHKILSDQSMQLLFAPTELTDGSISNYGYGWYTDGLMADHTGSWPGYQTRIIRNLKTGVVGISLKNVESYNWNWISDFDSLLNE